MTIYQTPLQFAYFFALLFTILFWYRGWKEERLSDKLLGFVMFFLAMEIQDYTFGFSGINILWDRFDGFPRYFTLAFAPTIYFYLKAQINRDFKLELKHLWHYLPYAVYFLVYIIVFLQGKTVLENFRRAAITPYLSWLETIAEWASYLFYFYKSLQIYNQYRLWTFNQFSDTEKISFKWLRNFIYLIIAGELFKYLWFAIDYFIDLPYEKDWWWHLLTVAIICYVGIKGYSQVQSNRLIYKDNEAENEAVDEKMNGIQSPQKENNYDELKPKIEKAMQADKLFLEPELSLSDMATKLKTNTSVLSAAINTIFGKNFNDFVNEFRIKEFQIQLQNPENKHYTKLAVAFDCGFNSKATFNRALKKFGGIPK
jgi:AraC-like DNA-binding protein